MTHEELPLERLKTEAERWIACVATDGSTSGPAARELRAIVQKAHDLGMSRTPPEAEDTARLDWLEKHRCTVYRSATGGTHWVVVDETKGERRGCLGKTLRAAVDDARLPQRETP